jgi:hypothetical protein
MNHEITVDYSDTLLRIAVRHYWLHWIKPSGFLLSGFLAVSVIVLLIIGDRSWMLGLAVGLFAIWTGVIIFSYFRLLNMSLDKFRRMEKPEAIFLFDEKGISVCADSGKTELAWKFFSDVLQYPDVWLLVVGGGSYITLPTAKLDNEIKIFILNQIKKDNRSSVPSHA